MKRPWSINALFALAVLIPLAVVMGLAATPMRATNAWGAADLQVLGGLMIDALPPPPFDPSNAFEEQPAAIELGRQLFGDVRLSRNGAVACASCHDSRKGFQDGRPVGQGVGTGRRRAMPIVGAAYSPWLFWDGRKDSLWSQALGPLEDGVEHGGNRTHYVHLLSTHYAREYEAIFGALPDMSGIPLDAGPLGTPAQRDAWAQLDPAERVAISRAFANMGKVLAAYERTLRHGRTRFDRYVQSALHGDATEASLFTAQEENGLRLFIGQGQCISCHNGPLFTDQGFHNTGVPARSEAVPDHGRRAALALVSQDEFNCLGPHSDALPGQCEELQFMSEDDPALDGAFKTPGLRGVVQRAPFMHAGQFGTLEQAIRHYTQAPEAPVGRSELVHGRAPIRLSEDDVRDLAAFLGTLSESGEGASS
ncbi:cytochrome-c peroxidase [Dyella amyloliquefaciens]|uniref:cytochrome-c peroxidase n=1 Tax=Dyella amyloliquefaciens TaxID=1770545 RepID=UPI00102E937C|nr:cytochrome c peroxidase [Dyella amyloliquefaciens]